MLMQHAFYLADGVPFATTITGVITAFGTLLTATALVITALAALNRSRRTEKKIDAVHKIVNQQRTDMQRYQAALVAALKKAGVEVPVDQSILLSEEQGESGGKHQALGT